jgi:hypothetical protein
MPKINTINENFDDKLKLSGKRRTQYRDYFEINGKLCFISKEVIIKESEFTNPTTPWWKNKKKGKK